MFALEGPVEEDRSGEDIFLGAICIEEAMVYDESLVRLRGYHLNFEAR